MQTVTEDITPIVGKYYNVRCAKMGNDSGEFYYMPIIGVLHNDKKAFGFPDTHYHIDGRFVGKMEADYIDMDDNGFSNSVCSIGGTSISTVKEILYRKFKCKRLTTGICPEKRGSIKTSKYWQWYDSFIGKSCAGKKCPHLGTKMVERNGLLVCPLHNLHGDLKTELIIHE